VQLDDPVLRGVAAEVPVGEITSAKIQRIIRDMTEALDAEPDGAALAAPQIGVPLRIFVLAKRVFGEESAHDAASKDPHLVFINPVIVRHSRKKGTMDEGCLSVRGRYGTIKRYLNATIRAYDERGERFERGAGGLMAQAFQHETDHLDGTLFIDHAAELWRVAPPKKD
jgi:peptide deformylase